MSEIERVWARIKHAAQQTPAPSAEEARTTVLRFFREERAERAPEEALEFLTSAFLELSAEAQQRLRATQQG